MECQAYAVYRMIDDHERSPQHILEPVINPMYDRLGRSLNALFLVEKELHGVSWALWRIFGRFIVRSPLDNIPGPPPTNWLKGGNKQIELHVNDD